MENMLTIPWNRYALIPELAGRLSGISPQFGKTVLQKIVFLLQEVYNVDCGYDFTLYSYGPFDSRLLGDLDLVESWGCVKVESADSFMGGYRILPNGEAAKIRGKAADFLDSAATRFAIDALINDYGAKSARDLELRATLIYVCKDLQRRDKLPPSRGELYRIAHEIKPKFSETDMNSAIEELLSLKHIELEG
jgi:uncharacterized protein YwgA